MKKPKLTSREKAFNELYYVATKELLDADARIVKSEASIKSKDVDKWLVFKAMVALHIQRAIRLSRFIGMSNEQIHAYMCAFNVEEVPDKEYDLPTKTLQ